MSPLQKSPTGLLGALELKQLGDNPNGFGMVVTPVVESLDFYTADLQSVQSVTANVTNAGDSLTLTVPNGVMWRLRALSGFCVFPAAAAAADGIGWQLGVSSVGIGELNIGPVAALAATTVFHSSIGLAEPLLLRPGTLVNLTNGRAYGAARSATLRAFVEVITQ